MSATAWRMKKPFTESGDMKETKTIETQLADLDDWYEQGWELIHLEHLEGMMYMAILEREGQ